MKYVYVSLILVFLGIIITSVYYLLGGFKEIAVYKINPTNRTVVGKQFVSHYTDDAWVSFGRACKEMLEQGDIEGTLTMITYHSDSLKKDEVSKFVGITLASEMAEIPRDFEVREFQSGIRYAVFLDMHVLVQPRPRKIEAMLLDKAQENGHELEDFFFELRYQDNSLSVEGWVKE